MAETVAEIEDKEEGPEDMDAPDSPGPQRVSRHTDPYGQQVPSPHDTSSLVQGISQRFGGIQEVPVGPASRRVIGNVQIFQGWRKHTTPQTIRTWAITRRTRH